MKYNNLISRYYGRNDPAVMSAFLLKRMDDIQQKNIAFYRVYAIKYVNTIV